MAKTWKTGILFVAFAVAVSLLARSLKSGRHPLRAGAVPEPRSAAARSIADDDAYIEELDAVGRTHGPAAAPPASGEENAPRP